MTKDGVLKTMFKPDACQDSEEATSDVWDYFLHG